MSRDAVPDEFWDGMGKATLADMPDTYKDAGHRLNPEPGHLERLFPGGHGEYLGEQAASGGDLRTMHATVPFLLRFLGE